MRTLTKLVLLAIALAALPTHAQIAFRAASSATAAGTTPAFRAAASAATTGATLTINRPSGTATNDVLIASIAVTPSSVSITPPSGWTLVRRLDNTGPTSNSLAVYYKVAGSSEPSSYPWGVSGASFAVGGVQAFSGIDTANPIHVENGQSTASSTTHTAAAVTTTVANALLVASHAFASSRTWSPPSGMSESFDRPSGSNGATGLSIEGSRVSQTAAGSSGNKTATAAGNADAGNAHLLALRPASASVSIATPAGTAVGDVMIASIGFNNAAAAITAPSGWILVRRMDNTNTTSNSLAVYRKTVVAGEPASHVWGVAGGAFLVGGIQSFSGVSTASPIDAEGGRGTPSGTNHDTLSIDTRTANSMLVTSHTYASSQNWSPAAGLTESFDQRSGSASATGQSITGTRQLQAAAGPSGTKRSTAAASADWGNTHILALRRLSAMPPSASITSPANGTHYGDGQTVNVTATASDPDGTIASVRFQVVLFIAPELPIFIRDETDSEAPYTFSFPINGGCNPSPCRYILLATAQDNQGDLSEPAQVEVTASPNAPPSVNLTSPTQNASFSAPANIALTAAASDSDGSIQKVEFFHGGTNLIQTITAPPYSFTWTGVPQGAYTLTAVATDNQNATTTSVPINITVNQAAVLHFIHVDHLNTPRLVADAAGTTVWKWDQQEPFGNNVADENPSGLGAFDLPLRLPGQYFDKETNLHYNYFRDYDPSIGRYVESDLIGLDGGLNTYAYGLGSPLVNSDIEGLEVTLYCRPLDGAGGRFWTHCYVHVTCPEKGIDEVLSLFGKFPWGLGGLPSVGFKSSASPMDGGPLRDDPSASGQWSAAITPQAPNCDCRCEKEVISRFYRAPPTQRYGGTSSNSNTFAQYLITSPSCGTSWPAGAPPNAVGTLPIGAGRIR